MSKIGILCVLAALSGITRANPILSPENFYHFRNISKSLNLIIDQDFAVPTKTLKIFTEYHPSRKSYFDDIVGDLLVGLPETCVEVSVNHQIVPRGASNYLILIESYQSLESLYSYMLLHQMETKGLFLIYLSAFDRNFYDDLLRIIHLHYKLNIVDVSVMIKPSQRSPLIIMYTYFPFNHHHCYGKLPVVINQYIDENWTRSRYFFPEKDQNMFGCPLVVATWQEAPYFIMAPDYYIESNQIVSDGLEGRLYEYFSLKLNFKMSFYWIPHGDQLVALASNETYFSELFADKAHVAIAGFPYLTTSDKRTFSQASPYFSSNSIFSVKVLREEKVPLDILLIPFSTYIWVSIFMITFTSMVLTIFVRGSKYRRFIFGDQNASAGYNLFVTMLGGPTTVEPNRNFARYLTMMWIILFLVLRNAYQSYLYQALRMDIDFEPPKTYKDIIKRGYVIWLNTFVYDYTEYLTSRYKNRFIIDDSSYIDLFQKMMTTDGKIGILCPHIYVGYYRRLNRDKSQELFLLSEVFHVYQLTIYMKKNFFMKDIIDQATLEYTNNGFLERWEKMNMDRKNYKRKPPATRTMTLNEALGAFWILGNGLSVAVLIFVLELVAFYIRDFVVQRTVNCGT